MKGQEMITAIKVILTLVFAGICITACIVDPKDPGPDRLWFGTPTLRRALVNKKGSLRKHTKPVFVLLVFLLFGFGILVIWSGP